MRELGGRALSWPHNWLLQQEVFETPSMGQRNSCDLSVWTLKRQLETVKSTGVYYTKSTSKSTSRGGAQPASTGVAFTGVVDGDRQNTISMLGAILSLDGGVEDCE